MLVNADLIAFVPTRDLQRSRVFYEQTLGLEFVREDAFAIVFKANGVMVRIANVSTVADFRPAPFTILGWRVENVQSVVRALSGKGVMFERFDGMQQDELGIWHSPSGAKVAWFKDPDDNVLSITES